jgi:large subunit ribosomal protein L9
VDGVERAVPWQRAAAAHDREKASRRRRAWPKAKHAPPTPPIHSHSHLSLPRAPAPTHTTQVVLHTPVQGLGAKGDLATVPLGFYRNFLAPQRAASVATPGILKQADAAREADAARAEEVKAKAKAMATALATIGKFVIKKKAGEGDAIFGAVTAAEVVAAIEQQTGRALDKRGVTLPDIKALGTYDATVRLHPEVVGEFKVVVQKEKAA